ncbi:conserved Plasmodium protein, unknown function [Plasmodium chabaudi adami]|uniref:Fam-b protein n=1 Tax=Plasmodium chabaudi adami TaxID=5826 RepID=A0A1C6YFN3_PLACE|nr:conserved Plasmodium protein, unknown function [Plasmodium chabaudi adami]
MSKLKLFFLRSFLFFVINNILCKNGNSIDKVSPFMFVQTKSKELNVATPPYTVFNFATEAISTQDIIEDHLKSKEKKAMRRFNQDLRNKRERAENILANLLSSSLEFFDAEEN